MKKTLVSMILVLCCLFTLVGCGGETSVQTDSTNTSVQSAEVAYSGDLAFYAALPDKSVCEDKIIEVSGEYTGKFIGLHRIGAMNDDFYVPFTFAEKTDVVKQLAVGDIITIRGECFTSEDYNVQLTDCELISVKKPEISAPVTESTDTPEPSKSPHPTNTPKPSNDSHPSETPTPSKPSTFSIHFIDVGQADAALIECDGRYMLIDGGNKDDSSTIYSVLKNVGASHLDIVVGTHAHEDHIGGIPGAFNYADADLTLCPVKSYDSDAFDDFKKYAKQKGGGIVIPSIGDTYSLGSASIKILGVNGETDTNNTSIVLMITYGETKFLFTGDAEREAEQVILNSGADLSATVLKVGHHGSDTSTTYPFLREIMPTYAVISVGTGNSYGHPTEDTLSRLRDADVKVYRTDLQGDIQCTSDGKSISFSVTRNANADTLTPATKTEPTPKPTPSNNPESDPKPEPTPTEKMVWIPNSGTKYHSKPSCSNMKNPTQVTKTQAEASGYTPCKKCY